MKKFLMKYDYERVLVCIMITVLISVLLLDYGDNNNKNVASIKKETQTNENPTDSADSIPEEGIPIISQTVISIEDAKSWAKNKGATDTFVNLADLYWKYCAERGNVNPALAYVQAAKETGFGNFGGVLDDSYHNPCGLKTTEGGGDYEKSAHTKFGSWDDGVKAHLDHLALYAGANGYPRKDTPDPRHFESIFAKATTAVSLNGKWSPIPTYGDELVGLYNQMLDSAGKVEVFATK